MNIAKDMDGKYICPHNSECRCVTLTCDTCGWNPEVAKVRLEELRQSIIKKESFVERKFKIPFTGYCEVWARSTDDALEKADDGDMFYLHYDFGDPDLEEDDG